MSDGYWSNKSFIVTGGGRGQGATESTRLLALGANVVIVDPLPLDNLDWDIGLKTHPRVRIVGGGVEQENTWNDALASVRSLGAPLAGLVNNAGISLRKTVSSTTLAEWERVMAINLTGAFLGIRQVAPVLMDGGSIVNVASTAALTGYFAAAYTASKWGLRGLSKAASIELAARGIRVNTVCPGLIDKTHIRIAAPLAGAGKCREHPHGCGIELLAFDHLRRALLCRRRHEVANQKGKG